MTDHYFTVQHTKKPSPSIVKLVLDFRKTIETLETKQNLPYALQQDGKSEAYFIDCHISSKNIVDLYDYEASLDPEEQDDIKANRDLQPFHKLFLKMIDDAQKGRQFNDIIVEYLPDGERANKPFKIYGGQHRAKSIEEAANKDIDRYHGFRVYFCLNVSQRNDIAQVSNANINVPIDLLDRMQETVLGPELRNWCKSVGLITKDFAERKNKEGIITARLARTFVVNFMFGKSQTKPVSNRPYNCYIGNEANEKYLAYSNKDRKKILFDPKLKEAGKYFVKLHRAQMDRIKKDRELSKTAEFKTKTLTPSILSAWAFTAGLLQNDQNRLKKLYELPEKAKNKNPLSAKEMSEYKHQNDNETYRGLGTRTDKRERGKLIELFLVYSEKQEPLITTALIDAAVTTYLSNILTEEKTKKMARIK